MVREYLIAVLAVVISGGAASYYGFCKLEERKWIAWKRKRLLWGAEMMLLAVSACVFQFYGYPFLKAARYAALMGIMPQIAWIDWKEKKILNKMLAVLAIIRVVLLLIELISYHILWKELLFHAAAGAVGSFLLLMLAYYISRRAIGMGDVKLFTVTGFYLGFSVNYIVLIASLVCAAIYGVWQLCRKKMKARDEIAFGPFAAAGVWLILLLGF